MVTQTQPTLGLGEVEKQAIREFLTIIRQVYGEKILRTALFGSRSRNQAATDSDIDLLLIVADESWPFQQALIEIAAEIGLKHDVLLDLRIVGVERWQYLKTIQAGLYQNIEREATPLP